MDGLLVIDKPVGWTSHDVVARVRHILGERRIGHTGTLDPFATGVLVLLIGRATRLAQFVNTSQKEYEAVIRLGYATNSGDITGTRLADQRKSHPLWTGAEVELALQSLRGEVQQVPPMYSAKKKAGEKLYELARRGIEVEREPVPVCVYKFEPIKGDETLFKTNHDGTVDLKVRVVCSPGTYVRTLAEDFGTRLHTGAHLAELRRTRAGEFKVETAVSLEQLKQCAVEGSLGTILLEPDAALSCMPFVHLTADDARRALHGLDIKTPEGAWPDATNIKILDEEGNLIGVGNFDAHKHLLHPRVVLTV